MSTQNSSILSFWKQLNELLWGLIVKEEDPTRQVRSEINSLVTKHLKLFRNLPSRINALSDNNRAHFNVCVWINENEDHLNQFINSYRYAYNALIELKSDPKYYSLSLAPNKSLWSFRRSQTKCKITVTFAYVTADQSVWSDLMYDIVLKKQPKSLAKDFALSESFKNIVAIYTILSNEQHVGKVYNLQKIFHEINALYFNNQIPNTPIVWGKALSYRKLGCYNFNHNTITISPVLDNNAIPPMVVDFVVFHEMLHIAHGILNVNGRTLTHTTEFKTDEKKFIHYYEVQKLLPKLRFICETNKRINENSCFDY